MRATQQQRNMARMSNNVGDCCMQTGNDVMVMMP
jgi:hypothetical protein